MRNSSIQIVVADDKIEMRQNLCTALETYEYINVIEQVGTAERIQEAVSKKKPDVLVMDLDWFGDRQKALSIIREIRSTQINCKIIAMTAYPELRPLAAEAGVAEALEKGFSVSLLADLIKSCANKTNSKRYISTTSSPAEDILLLVVLFILILIGLAVANRFLNSTISYLLVIVPSLLVWIALVIVLGRSKRLINQSSTYQLLNTWLIGLLRWLDRL